MCICTYVYIYIYICLPLMFVRQLSSFRRRLSSYALSQLSSLETHPPVVYARTLLAPSRRKRPSAEGSQVYVVTRACRNPLQNSPWYWSQSKTTDEEMKGGIHGQTSVVHAYTSRMGPVIVFLLSQEISMRFPTVFRQPLIYASVSTEAQGL